MKTTHRRQKQALTTRTVTTAQAGGLAGGAVVRTLMGPAAGGLGGGLRTAGDPRLYSQGMRSVARLQRPI